MLNIILSFAQYERELAAEKVRDKIAATRKKGLWTGGLAPLGFDVKDKKLAVNKKESELVRKIFESLIRAKSMTEMIRKLNEEGYRTKEYRGKSGKTYGGGPFEKKVLHFTLNNLIYNGYMEHKGNLYCGQHKSMIDDEKWQKVKASFINSKNKKSPTATNHSLERIINDSCRAAMLPSYIKKQGRKYCTTFVGIINRECTSSQRNIAAGEVEQIVIRILLNYDKIISGETWSTQEKEIRQVIKNVSVREGSIEISMNKNEEVISIPVKFKKREGRTMITETVGKDKEAEDSLLKALVRANLWQRQLSRGKFATISELCAHEKLGLKYVQYILRLNYLASKIKEEFLNGTQPDHLKLIDFRKNKIPLLWSEQMEKFYGLTEKAA